MSDKQWVQHISGQGEKWEVVSSHFQTSHLEWKVYMKSMKDTYHWLPKSEYRLCEPPEVWRDVSEGARVGSDLSCILYDNLGREISVHNGYRLRKVHVSIEHGVENWVDGYAFIVEQKVKS